MLIEGEGMLLISFGDEEVLCIEYDVENYLIIFIVFKKELKFLENILEFKICFINEMGGFMKLGFLIKGSVVLYNMFFCFKII